jgi:hypothetical protein
VLVPDKLFLPYLMFVREIIAYPKVKHLSDAPLLGTLLALPTIIRLDWIFLPGTNTIAYYENP